jgi:hypothetical protein
MKRLASVSAALLAAATAGTASAERPPADRVHDPHTMDRLTPVTTFGAELGYELWDGDSAIDTILGVNVAGHFVSDAGPGAYLVLPLSYVSTDDLVTPIGTFEGESEMVLGNIEVGGLYARPLGRDADMVFRVGVALPTADDDNDIGLLQFFASAPRYGDLVLRWPNSTWLRLGFSPMGRAGIFYWRADVGLDLMLDDDDGDGADISPVLRINAGGGLDLGSIDVGAELVTNVTNPESDMDDDTGSTLAFGARFAAGNAQPGIALIVPVGLDDVDDLDLAIAVSIAARMP